MLFPPGQMASFVNPEAWGTIFFSSHIILFLISPNLKYIQKDFPKSTVTERVFKKHEESWFFF